MLVNATSWRVTGIAAGADHRDAHAAVPKPAGGVVDQHPAVALSLGGGIDGQHDNLSQVPVGVYDRGDHEASGPFVHVRDPASVR